MSLPVKIDYDALAVALLKHNGGPGVATLVRGAGGVGDVGVEVGVTEGGSGVGEKLDEKGAVVSGGTEGVGAGGGAGETSVVVDGVGEVLSVSSGESSGSESSGGVSGGSVGVVSSAVKSSVKFGGFADELEVGVQSEKGTEGFFRTVVRSADVKAWKSEIEQVCGAKLPKAAMRDLLVCTFSAGTMPESVIDGKSRLRSLALVGDASIVLHLAVHGLSVRRSVESTQSVRAANTSDDFFRKVMDAKGWIRYVKYPSGVDARTAKTTATAFEAVVGVLTLYRDVGVVRRFLASVGVLR